MSELLIVNHSGWIGNGSQKPSSYRPEPMLPVGFEDEDDEENDEEVSHQQLKQMVEPLLPGWICKDCD
ncbi:MAG: hypothetical protein JXB00_09470 [Bacteroidales bacterium]|nr:hypothetical protein [Bacteroidales bacterium]